MIYPEKMLQNCSKKITTLKKCYKVVAKIIPPLKMLQMLLVMNGIREIRKKLGLTQVELAIWLQIPRSTLSLAEKGLRSLRATDLLKLAELERTMEQDTMNLAIPVDITGMNKNSPEVSRAKATIARLDSERSAYKLKVMDLKYKELGLILQRIGNILANTSDSSEILVWETRLNDTISKMEKCSPERQARLQERIIALDSRSLRFEARLA